MAIFTSKDLPNVRPIADFNFAATKTLDRKITFSRGSIGTYTDELGVVRYASNNVPRFDHDPTTGESLGLLIEESRTNQFPYSSEFDNGAWNKSNLNVTANQITAPDGTITADKISADATATEARYVNDDTSIINGKLYTQSVFAKAGEVTVLQIAPSTGFSSRYQNFDLSTGQLGNGDVESASITAYPNGWYRCTVTQSAITTISGRMVFAFATVPGDGRIPSPTIALGDGFYLWGAQLEEGSFPTSYIPTSGPNTGSTVTRAQDQTIVKRENFTKIFDTGFNSFSVLVDYDNLSTSDGAVYDIFTLWGESTGYTDRISVSKDNASPYHVETRAFGNNIAIFNNGNFTGDSKAAVQKLAFSWNVPSYSSSTGKAWKFSFSGADVGNVAVASTQGLPALTRMGIGVNPTRLTEAAGLTHFKRVAIYNQVLSDEELKSISAI